MTSKEQLIEQHIREYEARLKHVDELYVRAQEATEHLDDEHASRAKLEAYGEMLSGMQQKGDEIKTMHLGHWREETVQNAGPMAIWDILAQTLENFIERHSKSD